MVHVVCEFDYCATGSGFEYHYSQGLGFLKIDRVICYSV